jgi:hypothetical protein
MRRAAGELQGVVFAVQDIPAALAAEQALRERDRQLQQITDAMQKVNQIVRDAGISDERAVVHAAMAGGGFQLNGGFWFELPPGDCDEDGVVNLMDHEFFTQCLGGPNGGVLSGCECFDVDRSGQVDLRDFAMTAKVIITPITVPSSPR